MPCAVEYNGGRITYRYDAAGNISEIRENGNLTARCRYDTLNRLTREDHKKLGRTETYTYDGSGNITEKRSYAFTLIENPDELTSETKTYVYDGDKLISHNGEACEYDAIGNPTTYRGKSVTWEKGRNMTAYDGVTFACDGRGRRTGKGDVTFTYGSDGRLIRQSDGLAFIYDAGLCPVVFKFRLLPSLCNPS